MPFATALLDRFLSDTVAGAGNVSFALPLAAARIRDELDVAISS
jgi:hypothetical protein